ncbi:MAG: hypothetical protein KatS3mg035_0305 [Bacteroidia bacterium]|nr:MAG: hypothetical protein KatS3mg035_0305 [Bacteroidia bacterium]
MLKMFNISPMTKKILIAVVLSLCLVAGYFIYGIYGNNVNRDFSLYVRTGAEYSEVLDSLQKKSCS